MHIILLHRRIHIVLNIDFVGPFPDGGYILVIVCTFTRWIELYHTLDATALSAVTIKTLIDIFVL